MFYVPLDDEFRGLFVKWIWSTGSSRIKYTVNDIREEP